MRTNTAGLRGLGRLCTLFVCSTLLDFEHTHAVLSSTLVLCCTMVTTSTAAMSNSWYADTDRMKNVFLILIEAMVKLYHCLYQEYTYMCSLNFIGNIVFTLNHVYCKLSIVHG